MKTVTITEANALKAYKKADKTQKEVLVELFQGYVNFSEKITDRIKTVQDAFEEVGEDYEDFITHCNRNGDEQDEIAYKILKRVTKSLNPPDFVPDWNNINQRKWFPWFYLNDPGFRFCDAGYDWSDTVTAGGSRLCFATEDLAKYAANQFLSVYKNLIA